MAANDCLVMSNFDIKSSVRIWTKILKIVIYQIINERKYFGRINNVVNLYLNSSIDTVLAI